TAALARAAALKAAAAAKVASSANVPPSPRQPLLPPASVPPGGETLTVSATGYAIHGRTATGLETGWGVAAVDPSMIPLGTHFTVPGYGEAVAADVGSGIHGLSIDLWFPTIAQANAWG